MTTRIKYETVQMPTDDSTFDVTVGGESRTPVGVMVFGGEAMDFDTDEGDAQFSIGFGDFTDMGCCSGASETGVGTSDVGRNHSESKIYNRNAAGTSTVLRTITGVAAITGGVRFTPGEASGAQMVLIIGLVFGTECKMFSSRGDGDLAINETFNIAHGLSNAPKAAIFAHSEEHLGHSSTYVMSLGFASMDGSIKQGGYMIRQSNGQTTTDVDGRNMSNRVAGRPTASGGESYGFDLTDNDGTNTEFTNRINQHTNSLIGLLIEANDISVDMQIISTPASAGSQWDFTSLSFKPQAIIWAMTAMNSVDSSQSNAGPAAHGVGMVDKDGKHASAVVWIEDNRDATSVNTLSGSRVGEDVIYMPSHDNATVDFDFDSLTFNTDGWTVLDTPFRDSESAMWPMLAFEEVTAAPIVIPVPTGPEF